jgi:hypothetical protein
MRGSTSPSRAPAWPAREPLLPLLRVQSMHRSGVAVVGAMMALLEEPGCRFNTDTPDARPDARGDHRPVDVPDGPFAPDQCSSSDFRSTFSVQWFRGKNSCPCPYPGAIAAGGRCPGGSLASLTLNPSEATWSIGCEPPGTTGETWVGCTTSEVVSREDPCDSGIPFGGTCDCSQQSILRVGPQPQRVWACECPAPSNVGPRHLCAEVQIAKLAGGITSAPPSSTGPPWWHFVSCSPNSYVISGGCWESSGGKIEASCPWAGGTPCGDIPENGTTSAIGWVCGFREKCSEPNCGATVLCFTP